MFGRLFFIIFLIICAPAFADDTPHFELTIKDHIFLPAEIKIPANQRVLIWVKNLDATAEEIESRELQIEKVIAGRGEGTMHFHALAKGRYIFVGEYHSDTAKGVLIAE